MGAYTEADDAAILPTLVTAATAGGSAKLIRQIQYDDQGRIIAAPTVVDLGALATGLLKNTTGTGALSIGTPGTDCEVGLAQSYYKALALSRLGLTAGDKTYGFLWNDFDSSVGNTSIPGFQLSSTGSGAVSAAVAATRGGIVQNTSGATAASASDFLGNERLIAAIGTDKWWIGVRQAVTTAITAQTTASFGLYDAASKSVQIGVFGAGSTVNFCVQYDGSFATTFQSTGVPIDTSFHFFELYCKGDGKVYYRVDEGNEASVTPAAASAAAQFLYAAVGNGTDAVARIAQRDFVACLYPR